MREARPLYLLLKSSFEVEAKMTKKLILLSMEDRMCARITWKLCVSVVLVTMWVIISGAANYGADDGGRCPRCHKLTMKGGHHLCVRRKKSVASSVPKLTTKKEMAAFTNEKRNRKIMLQCTGATFAELKLMKDSDGMVVGMLGHKLGEHESQCNETGGSWEPWLMGRAYTGKLNRKIWGFTTCSLEYGKDDSLLGIEIIGRLGANRSHQDIEELLCDISGALKHGYGVEFTKSNNWHDQTVYDTYHAIQGTDSDGCPKSQIDLYVVSQENGGSLIYLALTDSEKLFKQYMDPVQESEELGLVKNSNGVIVGMLGHRLDDPKNLLNESGGIWRTATFGPCYTFKLGKQISVFKECELEYSEKYNRLCTIRLKAWYGPWWRHALLERILSGMRAKLEKEYGLRFQAHLPVGYRGNGTTDGTTFSWYQMVLSRDIDGAPASEIDLSIV